MREHQNGFTMIELLVAMALFSILSAMVAGSFVSITRSQRTVRDLILANDNASLVLEQISREIRTGSRFSLQNDGAELHFFNSRGENIIYRRDPNPNSFVIQKIENGGDPQPITASEVRVKLLQFSLRSAGAGQPNLINIILQLVGGRGGALIENIKINLQTSVSSRVLGG